MITEETIRRMCDIVKQRQAFETKDRGKVIANLPFSDFCKLVNEDVTIDEIELLERVQSEINKHLSQERLVFGYSSCSGVVHWHVLDINDPRYKRDIHIHITC